MTEADRGVFMAAWLRVCSMQGRDYDADQAASLFESKLRLYPAAEVVAALEEAAARSGRFLPPLGVITDVLKERRGDGYGQSSAAHAPAIERDPQTGQVIAHWRCAFCCDTGWRAVLTETGQLLTEAELQAWERLEKPTASREDGRPHLVRRRCACKAMGQQRGAA